MSKTVITVRLDANKRDIVKAKCDNSRISMNQLFERLCDLIINDSINITEKGISLTDNNDDEDKHSLSMQIAVINERLSKVEELPKKLNTSLDEIIEDKLKPLHSLNSELMDKINRIEITVNNLANNGLATISNDDEDKLSLSMQIAVIVNEELATISNKLANDSTDKDIVLATISNELAIKEDITENNTLRELPTMPLKENVGVILSVTENKETDNCDSESTPPITVNEDLPEDSLVKSFEEAELEILRNFEVKTPITKIAEALTGNYYTASGKTNWEPPQVRSVLKSKGLPTSYKKTEWRS